MSTPSDLLKVDGRMADAERRESDSARVDTRSDMHVHTPFGYCAMDVTPELCVARARARGLSGIACVEHAPQLYLPEAAYWAGEHFSDPDALHRARETGQDRIGAYRRGMAPHRSEFLRVGLEVECDREGNLSLLPEDRAGWDLLTGAVHFLPQESEERGLAPVKEAFMRLSERLCEEGVHVLGHPFRYFHKNRLPRPTELYRPLARILAASGVAAEINFHTNQPDPEFFRICREEGVRLVLGSDAHELREVGDFGPHLRLLKSIEYQ